MKKGDFLGDRMKGYEQASQGVLPRRMPVIIRLDGKAFHTVTRGCNKPFDDYLMACMNMTAIHVCKEAQGAVFAYVQSDEISILLHNYKRRDTQPWFNNEVQKIVSVSAALAAGYFSIGWKRPVAFDSRVFVLPESEVANYFVWRQQDATRNSLQMATRAVYSHKEVNGKIRFEMREMLLAKGIDWEDYPVGFKRGRAIVRETVERAGAVRHVWVAANPPTFSQDRSYVEKLLAVDPEE